MDSVFGPIFDVIGQVLAFLYDIVPNLGVDIILLTCLIMLILYPLTAKQAKSMMAMQRVQPEVKKLQQKYKGDRQKLNEEMMKFYQENKINPLAGCLPLLVQLPIFISLFNVLREPQKYVPKDSSLFHSLCDGTAQCAKGKVNAQHFLGLSVQRDDLDPPETGWQWCVIRLGLLLLPFVSYSGPRLVWYAGWQPSGFFGLKLNVRAVSRPWPWP
jgi:YidC/Oxa1 family membrane protein insertase